MQMLVQIDFVDVNENHDEVNQVDHCSEVVDVFGEVVPLETVPILDNFGFKKWQFWGVAQLLKQRANSETLIVWVGTCRQQVESIPDFEVFMIFRLLFIIFFHIELRKDLFILAF